MEVVGVVGNVRENPESDIPSNDAWYLPYGQPAAGPIGELTYVIKARQEESLVSPARAVVAQLDPDLPVFDALTMEERFARFTATERLSVSLTAILATLGIFLAAVGVYAVLAFSVRRRWPELGIRAALGAGPGDVRGAVIREAAGLLVAGLVFGAMAALLLRPWFDANLFPPGISEPAAAAAAAAGLALATAIAAIVPAARASRVDPIRAMAGR
jgi:ABC-type antimicrobial peptide transport system permease subunit